MERLRQEIQAVVGHTVAPTREQIRKMPYLAVVIKESMESRAFPHTKCAYAIQVFVSTHQSL